MFIHCNIKIQRDVCVSITFHHYLAEIVLTLSDFRTNKFQFQLISN